MFYLSVERTSERTNATNECDANWAIRSYELIRIDEVLPEREDELWTAECVCEKRETAAAYWADNQRYCSDKVCTNHMKNIHRSCVLQKMIPSNLWKCMNDSTKHAFFNKHIQLYTCDGTMTIKATVWNVQESWYLATANMEIIIYPLCSTIKMFRLFIARAEFSNDNSHFRNKMKALKWSIDTMVDACRNVLTVVLQIQASP